MTTPEPRPLRACPSCGEPQQYRRLAGGQTWRWVHQWAETAATRERVEACLSAAADRFYRSVVT